MSRSLECSLYEWGQTYIAIHLLSRILRNEICPDCWESPISTNKSIISIHVCLFTFVSNRHISRTHQSNSQMHEYRCHFGGRREGVYSNTVTSLNREWTTVHIRFIGVSGPEYLSRKTIASNAINTVHERNSPNDQISHRKENILLSHRCLGSRVLLEVFEFCIVYGLVQLNDTDLEWFHRSNWTDLAV